VDGSGKAAFPADVAIQGDRIVRVGALQGGRATNEIDGGGRHLCPGLIDAHVHTDLELLANADQAASIYQGVTSHVIGQDGISYAPASAATQTVFRDYFAAINGDPALPQRWASVKDYLVAIDGAAVNAAFLIPHGTVRYDWLGSDERAPTEKELKGMRDCVAQAMAEGAVGLSTGLEYLPGAYASTDELVALCEPVSRFGGVYVTHMRSYHPDRMEQAFNETVEIGRRARLPVHISHFNGTADRLGALLESARAKGADVSYETYPYLAGCTILAMAGLPKWVQAGGKAATAQRLADPGTRARLKEWFATPDYPWSAMQITYAESEEDRVWEGLRIPAAAQQRGQDVGDFICDLLIRTDFRVACIVHHATRTENDMIRLMQQPEHMGGSDGIYTGSMPHPRGYGSFARYLEYARDRDVMSLEEMVHHLSDRPARRFGFHERGQIREGWFADLILFDPARVRSEATYENGARLAVGMDWVFVNGQPALAEGKTTGRRSGRAIRNLGQPVLATLTRKIGPRTTRIPSMLGPRNTLNTRKENFLPCIQCVPWALSGSLFFCRVLHSDAERQKISRSGLR